MFCKKCGKENNEKEKFCGNCGAEILETNSISSTDEKVSKKPESKSFKLDMSKDGNRRSLMAVGLIILIRLLGPIFDSYLIAGIVAGVIFAVIDFSFKNKK